MHHFVTNNKLIEPVLEKASPLRPTSPSPASAISADLDALTSGNVEMRTLQKLALFSSEHDVPLSTGESDETEGDDMEREAAMRVWKENRLFDRLWEGLMQFLQPDRVSPACLPVRYSGPV